jgi:GT2 family glycosyltransferase
MTAVSVCIPTYNGARFVREAVVSVLQQSFADFELIVNDDCSTDETATIVRSLVDARIRFSSNERRLGLVGNWNRCLQLCSGQYVVVFHQDDVMTPGYLSATSTTLDRDPDASFAFSNIQVIDEVGGVSGDHWNPVLPTENASFSGSEILRLLASCGNVIPCQTVMMRSSHLEKTALFDRRLRYTPDLEMWLRLARLGRVAYIAAPLIKLRRHAGQESRHYLGRASEVGEVWRAFQIALQDYWETAPDGPQMLRLLLRHLSAWSAAQLRASVRGGHFVQTPAYAWQAARFQLLRGACELRFSGPRLFARRLGGRA